MESRPARVATKRLQGSVRKVAKSCMEIEAKLCSMEDRIVAVEDDMDTLKEQNAARDGQLTDVMWKIEDLENRQRRNNLRFLGIPEGLEGNNIQAYMRAKQLHTATWLPASINLHNIPGIFYFFIYHSKAGVGHSGTVNY
ncbi:hypothetical protein NDU88_008537 [Pleurodeles waltl]|uniref:Uncharacterized protein n=1 Tax=Pleurodeles waltl TaxID=8319 RepID=A0AAV7PRV2_PLEWA|nr:hypothetical protein NDU88_008537 [Pleurodeles waltl]